MFRVPKFSYYFMQSQQDREVVGDILFIASWWSDISPNDVTVYSNAEQVELWCDGVLVDRRVPDEVAVKHPPFTFANVRRNYKAKNRSRLVAKAFVGNELVAEQEIVTPGVPIKLKIEADTMDMPFFADGSDILAVRCYMIDNVGGVVPLMGDDHPILFEIEGEGEIVGDSSIWANPICPEGGVATVLVRSTCKAGEIKLKAKMLWEQGCGIEIPCSVKGDEIVITTVEC
jgi:beta-galactosidase